MMVTKLRLISKRSREDKQMKFNNLMHLINARNLCECFAGLKRGKAPGVDKMTLEEYGENLQEWHSGLAPIHNPWANPLIERERKAVHIGLIIK